MGKMIRTTRECSARQLSPELLTALKDYFLLNGLGDAETECIACTETISERSAGSSLETAPQERVKTAAVLTANNLVWVKAEEGKPPFAVGADLIKIIVRPHRGLFSTDQGLDINGLVEKSSRNIHGVIAMGPEEAALQFCEKVQEATNKLLPPRESKWPAWLGPWKLK